MNRIYGLAIAAGALGLSSLAGAQNSPLGNQYVTGRIGAFFPIDSNLRDVSNWFFNAGADLTFEKGLIPHGETFISADWLGKTSGGGRLNIFPFCVNGRFYLGNNAGNMVTSSARRTYAFVGLGLFLFDGDFGSTWRFGGRGGLGIELSNNVVAEGTIYLSTSSGTGGVRANALGLSLGYKF